MSEGATGAEIVDFPSSFRFHDSLCTARTGASHALAELLERYRPYLLLIANEDFPSELLGKLAPSDAVQETILKGLEHFPQFHGSTHDEFAGWLRAILRNHLVTVTRAYTSQKRDVTRELTAPDDLPDPFGSTASRQVLANERSARLSAAMSRLPEQTQQVILWRHRDNMSFAEIGAIINKSEEAARKIWARALERLHEQLGRD